MNADPYLFFDGNCREAMEFYRSCFGGDLQVMTYGDQPGEECASEQRDKVMHACLTSGDFCVMASDLPGLPDDSLTVGNNVQISVNCTSREEIDRVFAAIGDKGKVGSPLEDAFWGARFGMLTDRYGFKWMFSFQQKKG